MSPDLAGRVSLDLAGRALLLDALGTIVELEPPAPVLAALLHERFGIQITQTQAANAIHAEMAYYRTRMADGRDAESVAALRCDCAEVLRGVLPPTAQLRAIDGAVMTGLLLDTLRFRLFPDALYAIAGAREAGLRVVVVSNWDALLPEVLDGLGLSQLLHGIVTSAQVGAPKPSAAVFCAALALAGVEPHEALHVGDSFADDVIGAREVGIESILLRRDGQRGPAGVATIKSLDALAALRRAAPSTGEP
ncbi:MAG: HAD family hydrolase [Solirubrobacteraceae bacterium]